jgi:hypothetical protein
MTLVQQRFASDCGLAVVAMVAGEPLEDVAAVARDAGVFRHRGLTIPRMVAMLEVYTGRRWVEVRPDPRFPMAEWGRYRRRGAALSVVLSRHESGAHWVAVEGGKVYDPQFDRAVRIPRYPRASYRVTRILLPCGR